MNSILREKYSISSCIYLFSFLLFLSQLTLGQEIVWSQGGVGERPNLTFVGTEADKTGLLVSSPFANRVRVLNLKSGEEKWKRTFSERFPFVPLPLTEAVVMEGDQGTIWALKIESGRSIWELREPESLDYPISPTKFFDNHLFTFSRLGWLRKIDSKGVVQNRTRLNNSWGQRKAVAVPVRGSYQNLAYLDQSGRLSRIDPTNLKVRTNSLMGLNGALERTYGQSREMLGATLNKDASRIVSVQLPGLIESFQFDTGKTTWQRRIKTASDLFSSESQLLALPTLITWEGKNAVLILMRHQVTIFDQETGTPLEVLPLPSDAVAPPAFDTISNSYWVLCREHLLKLDSQNRFHTLILPVVGEPFTLKVFDNLVVVATLEGKIFAIFPSFKE